MPTQGGLCLWFRAFTRRKNIHLLYRHNAIGLRPKRLLRDMLCGWYPRLLHGLEFGFHIQQVHRFVAVVMDGVAYFIFCQLGFIPNIGARAIHDVPMLPTRL